MKTKIVVDKLNRIDEAPTENGQLLAYFTDAVWFEKYQTLEAVIEKLKGHEAHGLLELHLFDNEREYRCVFSRIESGTYGVIEHVAKDFPNKDKDDVYIENVSLEDVEKPLTILNHIQYSDETGMAIVDDYRLVMGEFHAEK